jgi:hypothetical protein
METFSSKKNILQSHRLSLGNYWFYELPFRYRTLEEFQDFQQEILRA